MRNICFIGYNLLAFALFCGPLKELAELSFDDALYSHFLLIPMVSIYFFVLDRKTIFAKTCCSLHAGIPLLVAGVLICWVGKSQFTVSNRNDYLSLMMFSYFSCFIGAFISCYGIRAFRKALFPLLFLIFIVPIPTPILDSLIKLLLIGSADISYAIFRILGVPVYRVDFVFELPGIAVEVAKQCSGIRSTIGMFITSVIAGHMLLRTGWGKIGLILAIFPITIFKNAVRICTISLLAAYVDKSWLTSSWLHKSGGIVFFGFGLIFLAAALWMLRKFEKKRWYLPQRDRVKATHV